jgi:hypothetical protein
MAQTQSTLRNPNQSGEYTVDQMTMEQRIAQLESENARLRSKASRSLTLRVSEKGGLSVYGMGRFPVTLYKQQWQRLLAPETVAAITEYIRENDAYLTVKD